jgi:hypothetical protein
MSEMPCRLTVELADQRARKQNRPVYAFPQWAMTDCISWIQRCTATLTADLSALAGSARRYSLLRKAKSSIRPYCSRTVRSGYSVPIATLLALSFAFAERCVASIIRPRALCDMKSSQLRHNCDRSVLSAPQSSHVPASVQQ